MKATATDRGESPIPATIDLEILVVESHKKAPTFRDIRFPFIEIKENENNFSYPVATITAM